MFRWLSTKNWSKISLDERNYGGEYRFKGEASYFEVRIHGNISFAVRVFENKTLGGWKHKHLKLRQPLDRSRTNYNGELVAQLPRYNFHLGANVINNRVAFQPTFSTRSLGNKAKLCRLAQTLLKAFFFDKKKQVKAHSLRLTLSGTNGLSIFRLKNYWKLVRAYFSMFSAQFSL